MRFRSETTELFTKVRHDQQKMLNKILESQKKLYSITPHTEVCSNEECTAENPICDHAKYMLSEIKKHNDLVEKEKQKYLKKYPEAKMYLE